MVGAPSNLTLERRSPNKWLERTMLASRRLLEGEQAPRHFARRSATPLCPAGSGQQLEILS